jgi:hypothetical protein
MGWRVKGMGDPTKETSSQKPNFALNLFTLYGLPIPSDVGQSIQAKGGREDRTQKRGKKKGHLFLVVLSIAQPQPTPRSV